MKLLSGGIDAFYVDESTDERVYLLSVVRIPFLRQVDNIWEFQWHQYLDSAKEWRASLRDETTIPTRKELKGQKLASGRGRYREGKHSLGKADGNYAYRKALLGLDFLPSQSIWCASATRAANLYGHGRMEAALYALLQRVAKYCERNKRNGLIFFDEGHKEYRHLYRRACVHLPTGSMLGGWGGGALTKNLPLSTFVEDANYQDSRYSHFVQIADLVAYAAAAKVRHENGLLAQWQTDHNVDKHYDTIPAGVINTAATMFARKKDGIVRL